LPICLLQTAKSFKQHKNINISGKLEAQFGQEARQGYLALKSFYKFLTQQTPTIRSFTKVFKKHRIELIHTHTDLLNAKPEIMAAWLLGLPCISHNHGYYRFTAFDMMFVRFVDAFIYISEHVAEHHVSQGKPRGKGTIIHNGVDLSKFLQKYDTVSVREEFGLKHKQVLVGIIGLLNI